jgi:thiamine biosynthesis lipoprotein
MTTEVAMGTIVTIEVVRHTAGADDAVRRAFAWFHEIEDHCTRFNPQSELMRLTAQAGAPVQASPIVFEAVRFALMVAEESGGAFDPTVGVRRHSAAGGDVSYRDVEVDPDKRTITLLRPLTLDLGAVAKGLAVDTAARELQPFGDFAIDAGGDLYLGGLNEQRLPWSVGIRHPRDADRVIASLLVSDQAVCTSGDYERPLHLLDPRTGEPADRVASATVVAPGAMLADALATAAFVLGPEEGLRFLDRLGVEGLIVTPELERLETRGLRHAA